MPVIKCMVSRVYCGPKFEKHRLHKDESMAIKPGQVPFFQKLIDSGAIIVLDNNVDDDECIASAGVGVIDVEPPTKTKEDSTRETVGDRRDWLKIGLKGKNLTQEQYDNSMTALAEYNDGCPLDEAKKPEIKTVIAAAVNGKNTPPGIVMPSINPNTNLKKNNRAKHRHKNKRK